MGTCIAGSGLAPVSQNDLKYDEMLQIHIKQKDHQRCVTGTSRVIFRVKHPSISQSDRFNLDGLSLKLHGAVIPNQDPRNQLAKACQDLFFYLAKENTLLIVLYDGHGENGKEVVEFCKEYMSVFFLEKDFSVDPSHMVRSMIVECDVALAKSCEIQYSGTTVVAVYISPGKIIVGSAGDSRAVLATSLFQEGSIEEKASNPYRRKFEARRSLYPLQLTVDHKPNLTSELLRIQESGGSVQKLIDHNGDFIGPFRVWAKGKNKPGLAVSRSLGDQLGKTIGVIADPFVQEFPIFYGHDQFLVIASDGIWDSMHNHDVVNFVEGFRSKCRQKGSPTYPVTVRFIQTSNANIAHLLAEEARYQWLGICEEEDVLIDDISAVVIEIDTLLGKFFQVKDADRRIEKVLSASEISQNEQFRQIDGVRTDAVRYSTTYKRNKKNIN